MVQTAAFPATKFSDISILTKAEAIGASAPGRRVIDLERGDWAYRSGDRDSSVYLISRGQIRLFAPVSGGRHCLFGIRREGAFFGETCLSGRAVRFEAAMAGAKTTLIQLDKPELLESPSRSPFLEALFRQMTCGAVEQDELIHVMRTRSARLRLERALLFLSRICREPGSSIWSVRRDELQEDLAMIGRTTTKRAGAFLNKFRMLEPADCSGAGYFAISVDKLRDYIEGNIERGGRIAGTNVRPAAYMH